MQSTRVFEYIPNEDKEFDFLKIIRYKLFSKTGASD